MYNVVKIFRDIYVLTLGLVRYWMNNTDSRFHSELLNAEFRPQVMLQYQEIQFCCCCHCKLDVTSKQAPSLHWIMKRGFPSVWRTHTRVHIMSDHFLSALKPFLQIALSVWSLGVEWKSYVKTFLEFVFLSNYIVRTLQDCFWQFIIPFWRIPSRLWESNSDLCSPALFLNFSIWIAALGQGLYAMEAFCGKWKLDREGCEGEREFYEVGLA